MTEDRKPGAGRGEPPVRADYARFVPLTTRWSDNDAYGHMNNVVHYALFDSAVNAFLIGAGLLDLRGQGPIGLVVESGCRYHRELAFPQPVTAGLRVGHLGRSSVRYEIALFGGEAETAAADGFFVHVSVERLTRRPVAHGEAMRRALQEMMR
ncbi:thioesterase family protein [Aurantimonas sp. Leaf443]|uniref:acyl-CoA thioesterase n=1 Tax=Aurantimonas sp. Leaf443 TaxID=1736378 RepID=UPI0006FC419D|nr:thioesterase family protein [Aurantimonas sp. Leaf443]KQT83043.1 thioesterase [Aurantimonas sp. Leaf443]